MIDRIVSALTEAGVPDGAVLTVAFSGGADSTSLLHIMASLRETRGYTVTAAHFHHGLRGAEADADERFCRSFCERLAIPLSVGRADVRAEAERTGEGIEEAARRLRYAFLEQTAPGYLLTAHTADDQLETVLMDLCRGAGVRGLAGIPPARGRILRPMLSVTRKEIEQYCAAQGLAYCTDRTNADETYRRNYIRHTVVPALETLNPRVRETVAAACRGLSADADHLEAAGAALLTEADTGDGLAIDRLLSADAASRAAALRRYVFLETGLRVSRPTVEELDRLLSHPGRYNFEGGHFALSAGGKLRLTASLRGEPFSLPLSPEPDGLVCGGFRFSTVPMEEFRNFSKIHKKLLFTALDYDKLTGAVWIRSRRPGDRLHIAGRDCGKTVPKLLAERGVPPYRRDEIPLVADENGVAMVCGYAVAASVALDGATKRVLIALEAQEG